MREVIAYIFVLVVSMLLTGCVSPSPLMTAVGQGDVNSVQALLDKGADVNEWDGNCGYCGYGALGLAAWNGHTEVVKLLIERGAKVG